MTTQKHHITNNAGTLTIVLAIVMVAATGYGLYAMTRPSVDNFQLDFNVKHQITQPTPTNQPTSVGPLNQQ